MDFIVEAPGPAQRPITDRAGHRHQGRGGWEKYRATFARDYLVPGFSGPHAQIQPIDGPAEPLCHGFW